MATARPKAKPKAKTEVAANASVEIRKLADDSFMGFHNELGTGDFGFGKVRFCQALHGGTFYLQVGKPGGEGWSLYAVSTEDLMNSVLNAVAPLHAAPPPSP